MATCICDGPPHKYVPSWCIRPKFVDSNGRLLPMPAAIPGGAPVIVNVTVVVQAAPAASTAGPES